MAAHNKQVKYFASREKQFPTGVVFVPHFGGSSDGLRRHIELVNSLGFDAWYVELSHNSFASLVSLPLSSRLKFGLRHLWAEEIEYALNRIPHRKIVFSFSFPSAAALEAISNRHATDMNGWICDGGPFFQVHRCTWNLYSVEAKMKNPLTKGVLTALSPYVLTGLDYKKDMRLYLKNLPKKFPILNIRSWRDRLVPPSAIDEVFDGQKHLAYETLALPEAEHILGLWHSPEEYKTRIQQFLQRHGQ